MLMVIRLRQLVIAFTFATGLLALSIGVFVPLVGAGPPGCQILAKGPHPTLQAAVDAVAPGDRIHVKGHCTGTTVIDKDLTIIGKGNLKFDPPTLDGDGGGSVLTVNSGVSAVIKNLIITNGAATKGGGIHNSGVIELTNSTLIGNSADDGGGIANRGPNCSLRRLRSGTPL